MQEAGIDKEGRMGGKQERKGRNVNHGWTPMNTDWERTLNSEQRERRLAAKERREHKGNFIQLVSMFRTDTCLKFDYGIRNCVVCLSRSRDKGKPREIAGQNSADETKHCHQNHFNRRAGDWIVGGRGVRAAEFDRQREF